MINKYVLAIGINIPAKDKEKIKKELKQDDIILNTASIKDIIFQIVNGEISLNIKDKDISKYCYIWIQSGWKTTHMAYLLHLCLKSKNIPHNKVGRNGTKLSDICILAGNNIPVPNTFFHNGGRINDKNINTIKEICKFPCIYKIAEGSLGSNVYIINNEKEIKETILENKKYNRYIFQEYIPNDFDYRVVIANGKPTSVSKRTRTTDDYRNNVALGADEDFFDIKDIPNDVLDIAVRASKALNLNWAGVDVVTHKETGKNYVLEVNRRPGLTEKSSEITAAYKYIKGLVLKS